MKTCLLSNDCRKVSPPCDRVSQTVRTNLFALHTWRLKSSLPALIAVALTIFVGSLSNTPLLAREVQKVGTASLTTLKISTSVRAIGMGDAYVATADDISSIFWNPAGLIHIAGSSAAFTQINMPADVQFNTAAFAKNFGQLGVFGVHLLAMNTGDMVVRTIQRPQGTGEKFIAYDVIGGVSWAQRLTDRFIFGANLRVAVSGLEKETFTGALADIGALYETNLRTLKLGFSVQNFGPDVKYSGNYTDFLDQGRRNRITPQEASYSGAPPPTIYRIGVSANFFEFTTLTHSPDFDGIIAFEMSHPNDNRERLNLGAEFWYRGMLAIRGGYKFRISNSFGYDEERFTSGFGLKIPIDDQKVATLDYAYLGFGKFAEAADGFMESPHRFSFGINF